MHGSTELGKGEKRTSKYILIHPGYNPRTQDYDAALIFIEKPFNIAIPIALDNTIDYSGPATVAGWGRTHDKGEITKHLKSATMEVIDNSYCNYRMTNRMICAKPITGSTCNGDSGGPLIVKNNGYLALLGIVSFGPSSCEQYLPTVFTKVGMISDWVFQDH